LKHHQHLLQKLNKNKDSKEDFNNTDSATPPKMRKLESSNSKSTSQGSNLPKQLIKDLRVRVERLSSDGNTETQTVNDETDNKEHILKTIAENEERQVPHLPVAEDEPAREITSTCPLGLKKEGSQEDMVTSSCQEPRSKCVLVQTEQIQTDGLPAKVNLCKISGRLVIYHLIVSQLHICQCIFIDQKRTQNLGTTNNDSIGKITSRIRVGKMQRIGKTTSGTCQRITAID